MGSAKHASLLAAAVVAVIDFYANRFGNFFHFDDLHTAESKLFTCHMKYLLRFSPVERPSSSCLAVLTYWQENACSNPPPPGAVGDEVELLVRVMIVPA